MSKVLLPVTAGVAVAWMLSKYVKSQLYGLGPHDPVAIAAAITGLALVACAAGYIPALRATRIDPMHLPKLNPGCGEDLSVASTDSRTLMPSGPSEVWSRGVTRESCGSAW